MAEPTHIGKILESGGLKEAQKKHRYDEWNWVELTQEEIDDALGYRRFIKGSAIKDEEKKQMEREKRLRIQASWTFDELKDEILNNRVKRLPFDFEIDEQNRYVFELLLMYFTNNPAFEMEEIEYKDGKKMKLSLNKGIGLISAKKGTGKTILMSLFQANKSNPYLQIETKDVSAMYKRDGEQAIIIHSDLIHIAPNPTFFFHQNIGLCFNDLGYEIPKNNWGDKSDVMADVLFNIYSKYQKNELSMRNFHFTSNLSGNDFESRYGDRIRDRMREMFNVIILPGESRRK